MSRRDSREAAVKIIFQNMFTDSRLHAAGCAESGQEVFGGPDCAQMIETYFECTSEEECGELDKVYIDSILEGVIQEVASIDQYIVRHSKDWTIDRMSRIDLAIMRVAIFEILYREDIPASVSINEAVELAKKYSHEDAGSFINGILGSIYSESNT
ncbi:MAG: transcription antitermination factor NusB [Clostridia bacterium]